MFPMWNIKQIITSFGFRWWQTITFTYSHYLLAIKTNLILGWTSPLTSENITKQNIECYTWTLHWYLLWHLPHIADNKDTRYTEKASLSFCVWKRSLFDHLESPLLYLKTNLSSTEMLYIIIIYYVTQA